MTLDDRPTCPGCVPRLSYWPSGRDWGHARGCIYDDGQKIDYLARFETPSAVADASPRRNLIRGERHRAETARTGVLPRSKPPVIALRPQGQARCPAHPTELLYECAVCANEGD